MIYDLYRTDIVTINAVDDNFCSIKNASVVLNAVVDDDNYRFASDYNSREIPIQELVSFYMAHHGWIKLTYQQPS